jgi:FtsP/CotA-like multicopper oxidase with cupredoxin domain
MFQSFWRLVSEKAIEVTSEDDGQQFGLMKTRVNAAEQLKMKVGEERISDVRIDDATSDLTFQFGQSLRLEVISTSSGYEAWSLHAKEIQIIGRNGDTVVFSSPKSI